MKTGARSTPPGSQGRERGVDEIHVDDAFMEDGESDTRTVLVAKHAQIESLLATVVPVKGMPHEFPGRRVRAFCRELGLEARTSS